MTVLSHTNQSFPLSSRLLYSVDYLQNGGAYAALELMHSISVNTACAERVLRVIL